MQKDYYKILGVNKNATESEIKKAFHKLAHKYHPDKKGGDEVKFKEASEAYAVLGNKEKRKQYDQMMSMGGMGGGSGAGFGGFDFSQFGGFGNAGGTQGFEFDLGDLFSDLFRGGYAGSAGRSFRGRDIQTDVEITLSEALLGTKKKIQITKPSVCEDCKGTGAEDGKTKTCKDCGGKGYTVKEQKTPFGVMSMQVKCQACEGMGQVPENICKKCNGTGSYTQTKQIEVNIPAGIQEGQMLRVPGEGEPVKGGKPGDLIVIVHIKIPKRLSKEQKEAIENLRKLGL